MNRRDFFKQRIFPVLFMIAVTVVSIAIVAGISLSTRDIVERNEDLVLKEAILSAADIALPDDFNEVDTLFHKLITVVEVPEVSEEKGSADGGESEAGASSYYAVNHNGNGISGYVFIFDGPGLWGTIEAAIGFDASLQIMTGIEFLSQSETPGLGARITEPWFKLQFKGKKLPVTMVPENSARAANEVDAITGATRTSNYVLDMINSSSQKARTLMQRTAEGEDGNVEAEERGDQSGEERGIGNAEEIRDEQSGTMTVE